MNTAGTGTQAITRALGLLKQFHAARELPLAELQRRSGLHRSTVLRLLGALEADGMLLRDAHTRNWRLGPQIAALGRLADRGADLPALAQPELEVLAAELHETVTLEVLHDQQVRIVAEALGGQVLGAMPSLHSSWPAHATATGKMLWSALDARARDELLDASHERFTAHTLSTRAQLAKELQRIARRGWAGNQEELESGYVAVAVPVHDARGTVVAALSTGGPKNRFGRARLPQLAERLQRSAQRITQQLGG